MSIYNPLHGKGTGVLGVILGLFGISLAVWGTAVGILIATDADKAIVGDLLRFISHLVVPGAAAGGGQSETAGQLWFGLIVILQSNVIGMFILGLGKIWHFFARWTEHAERVERHNRELIDVLTRAD